MANDIFGEYDVPIYPDIAVNPDGTNNDITDPTSGQPNVSTPASPIPTDGWPGNGIPIFSDFNKLFRMITQWIRWFYDHIHNNIDFYIQELLEEFRLYDVSTNPSGLIWEATGVLEGTFGGVTIYSPSGWTTSNTIVEACVITNVADATDKINAPFYSDVTHYAQIVGISGSGGIWRITYPTPGYNNWPYYIRLRKTSA